jgi:hypothetical protein
VEPQKTSAALVPVRALPQVSHSAAKRQGAISLSGAGRLGRLRLAELALGALRAVEDELVVGVEVGAPAVLAVGWPAFAALDAPRIGGGASA